MAWPIPSRLNVKVGMIGATFYKMSPKNAYSLTFLTFHSLIFLAIGLFRSDPHTVVLLYTLVFFIHCCYRLLLLTCYTPFPVVVTHYCCYTPFCCYTLL